MQQSMVLVSSVKRVRGKAILTLSSGETLHMPRAMLKERPYRSGMPFDLESHHRFVNERSYAFALQKAISLLAVRARTEQEIVQALQENAYPQPAIARVVAKLHDAGYINDADFASAWSASRVAKGVGSQKIRMELRKKGVDADTAEQALSAIDADDQLAGALLAARKAARGKNLALPADRQKVLAALARRGYSFSIAKHALDELRNR